MPFGGVKSSGYGRFGGKAGVDAFTELRWITLQTTPRTIRFSGPGARCNRFWLQPRIYNRSGLRIIVPV